MANNDLISRSALIAEYDRAHKGPSGRARQLMEKAPAVDAVPVVRCKDCKWYMNGSYLSDMKFCCRMRNHNGERARYNWPKDGFCSYGERKTDEKPAL